MLFLFTFYNKEKNSRIFKNLIFFSKLKTFKTRFFLILSFINLPCGHIKNVGPIGSAVLTFIGYTEIDKPNLYLNLSISRAERKILFIFGTNLPVA